MRKVNKKILISILTSVIVLMTIVATTFAWVGIFTYANTDPFSINLKVSELDANYFLTISASGEMNTFSDDADIVEIERQILKNQNRWTESELDEYDTDEIMSLYSRYSYVTPSTTEIEDNKLTRFRAIEVANKDRFKYYYPSVPCLKFDIYLSVNTKEGIKLDSNNLAPEDLTINSNVYMTELENTLIGTLSTYKLFNGNQFNLPSVDPFNVLGSIPSTSTFKINSANATRFALSIYNPINISESYDDSVNPTKTLIYQGGTQVPTLENEIYNLGGNLPEDSNTALKELLVIRPSYTDNNPGYVQQYEEALEKAIERGENDIELVGEKTSIWNKPLNPGSNGSTYNYLGVQDRIQTKMKISVYYWFEGWDADCLSGIDKKPVTMNLTFTSGIID